MAMNGATPGEQLDMHVANPIVKMLEEALVEARAGRISSLGLILATPIGGMATPWAGPQTSDIYLGCGLMQARIMMAITQPARSSIVRAPAGALG